MTPVRLAAATAVALVAIALVAALSPDSPARPSGDTAGPTHLGLPHHTAALVADAATGRVLYADHPHRRVEMASTAKLMTALVVLERAPLDGLFTVPAYAAAGDESRVGLATGERMSVRDLLRGMLLPSGNDAAAALATGVAGSLAAFVPLMNARARALGLRDTHFADPIGLDPATRSSAADLMALTRVLRRNAFFRETVAEPSAALATGIAPRTVRNTNDLLEDTALHVDGVKTGHTDAAGYVLVGSATRGGRAVISAVLGTRSERARDQATRRLLAYGLGRLGA
jgi:D-alanyl-D-alanine carboxypeptidase (penicillin-binding protein 5/6)